MAQLIYHFFAAFTAVYSGFIVEFFLNTGNLSPFTGQKKVE